MFDTVIPEPLKVFYLFKIAPCVWFAFGLISLGEFILFFYQHNRTVHLIRGLSTFDSGGLFAATPITEDQTRNKNIYAAYCNLTFFIFLWLMGEWLLSVFRHPANGRIALGLFDLWRSQSDFPALSLPDLETRRWATAAIITFMFPTLVMFCEAVLTITDYPFSLTRLLHIKLMKFEKHMKDRYERDRSKLAWLFLFYRSIWFFPIIELLIEKIKGSMAQKFSVRDIIKRIFLHTLRPIAFAQHWMYRYLGLPLVFCVYSLLVVWRPNPDSSNSLVQELYEMSEYGSRNSISLLDRFRITLHCLLICGTELFVMMHLFYWFSGNYNAKDCFYFVLFPQQNWVPEFSYLFLSMAFVALVLMVSIIFSLSRVKRYGQTGLFRFFGFSGLIHVAISFGMAILAGNEGQVRGWYAVSFLLILYSGAWFMVGNFHNLMKRILDYHSVATVETLSFDILHRMKNGLLSVSAHISKVEQTLTSLKENTDHEKANSGRIETAQQSATKALVKLKDMERLSVNLVELARSEYKLEIAYPVRIASEVISEMLEEEKFDFVTVGKGLWNEPAWIIQDCLKEIFKNIVQNALDQYNACHTRGIEPPPFKIRFECGRAHKRIVLNFQDNCGGVTESDFQKIGQIFYSTKKTWKNQRHGSALFTARRMVALMNGSIDFSNRDLDGSPGFHVEIQIPRHFDKGEN